MAPPVMRQIPKQLGMKKNFGWALTGNIIYQACQWMNLVILAKLLDVADVGRFALAMAICTPITIFFAFRLRQVQVTDVENRHGFGDYLAVQITMSALALLTICSIAVFFTNTAQSAALIVVVGLGQAVVVNRDVFIAFNMKHERMDAVTVSKVFLGVGSLTAMGLVVWHTRNLLLGVIAMQAAKLAVLLLWDLRATARMVKIYTDENPSRYLRPNFYPHAMGSLIWLALPLGITAVLASLSVNTPRYLIKALMPLEMLGYFAAIFALVEAGHLVVEAAGLSALPRLSRYYLENRRTYLRLLLKLAAVGAIMGPIGVAAAVLAGPTILTLVFTPDYARFNELFIWVMIYGTFAYMISFLEYGMTATRRFNAQPFVFFFALLVITGTGFLLIPNYGLIGAVWSLIAGKIAFGAGSMTVISLALRKTEMAKHAAESQLNIAHNSVVH